MPGYFSVERDFLESDFWLSEPFTKPQAWVDLFGVANHSSGYFVKRGIQIPIERSQTGRSELTLAKRWTWSRNKVRRFLKWLEKEKMISLKQDNKTSVITICNYEVYQGRKTDNDTPSGTPNDTPERHQKDTKRNTNNKKDNVDNVENDKIKYVVEYLNKKLGTNFKPKSSKTVSCITARLNDGYTWDDFKTVIDKKHSEWFGTESAKYLRPETLFGNKFDGYLNQLNESKGNKAGPSKSAQKSIDRANKYINS